MTFRVVLLIFICFFVFFVFTFALKTIKFDFVLLRKKKTQKFPHASWEPSSASLSNSIFKHPLICFLSPCNSFYFMKLYVNKSDSIYYFCLASFTWHNYLCNASILLCVSTVYSFVCWEFHCFYLGTPKWKDEKMNIWLSQIMTASGSWVSFFVERKVFQN